MAHISGGKCPRRPGKHELELNWHYFCLFAASLLTLTLSTDMFAMHPCPFLEFYYQNCNSIPFQQKKVET